MKQLFTHSVILLSLVSISQKASSQQPPLYSFTSFTLDSGAALKPGAVYRFASVYPGVDAQIKIVGMSGNISLSDIDRTADGYSEAFQPEYRISGNSNAWIDFKITFVNAGTTTVVSRPLVAATGLDIDGSSGGGGLLKEFNHINMGGGTAEYNTTNTQLSLSQNGNNFIGANTTGILFGALVDTSAKEVMYTVTAQNVSSLTYRVGADNQMNSTSTRYASLYFKKFAYSHSTLASSNITVFNGSLYKNTVSLQWDVIPNGCSLLVLEKSVNGTDFSALENYSTDPSDMVSRHFSYTDRSVNGTKVYYRLRLSLESGRSAYSNILYFRPENSTTTGFNVYPTAIQSFTTVSIESTVRSNALVRVTDLSGRVVKQQQLLLNPGNNTVTLNGMNELRKGQYVVSVNTMSGIQAKQVMVE